MNTGYFTKNYTAKRGLSKGKPAMMSFSKSAGKDDTTLPVIQFAENDPFCRDGDVKGKSRSSSKSRSESRGERKRISMRSEDDAAVANMIKELGDLSNVFVQPMVVSPIVSTSSKDIVIIDHVTIPPPPPPPPTAIPPPATTIPPPAAAMTTLPELPPAAMTTTLPELYDGPTQSYCRMISPIPSRKSEPSDKNYDEAFFKRVDNNTKHVVVLHGVLMEQTRAIEVARSKLERARLTVLEAEAEISKAEADHQSARTRYNRKRTYLDTMKTRCIQMLDALPPM